MPTSYETPADHTNDEALRGFEFDRPTVVQVMSEVALIDTLFNSLGEDRDGASVVPATD